MRARGLKSRVKSPVAKIAWSRPHAGAWIEMTQSFDGRYTGTVAPPCGRVD